MCRKRKHRHVKTVRRDASNRVNDMQRTIKSIGAAAIRIMAAIAVTGPAGSGAAELADPLAVALDPCPLPMQAHEAAALWVEGWQRDAIETRGGLVLQTRVALPPTADTGLGCPIARTTS
jgi:hypothetical protein